MIANFIGCYTIAIGGIGRYRRSMFEYRALPPSLDLVLPASSEEDDVHNMQCVIDSLALDVLHTSLAHIVGQDVVRGRRMSIINLLDIFSGLLEYILDGIEKEETSSAGK